MLPDRLLPLPAACLQRGQAPLSDLQVTTSSEALLCGKAPTFRLLVWAVDNLGEPVSNVTYVVSENFVVRLCACLRECVCVGECVGACGCACTYVPS